MTLEKAKARHAELVKKIRKYDRAYDKGHPLITDYEYDLLEQELLHLEKEYPRLGTPDSPTKQLRSEPLERFKRRDHLVPMLSLDKIQAAAHPTKEEEPDDEKRKQQQDENTIEEFKKFDASIRKQLAKPVIEYVIEPKVDGVSISVHYRHGKLELGMTRGTGKSGDDITENIRRIAAIPKELKLSPAPPLIEVRGEVYISKEDFDSLNSKVEAEGEEPFPNARNAAAGTLKQLDPELVAQRPLSAVFYAVGASEGINFETHAEVLDSLKKFGLPTQTHWWRRSGVEEVLNCYTEEIIANYNEKHDLRTKLPYDIDGIVIKVNNISDWTRIPTKAKSPGYAIVHKPIPWILPAETILRKITIQVGRTGVLTPVAELDPVFVQGSTISRATLHNEDEIHRKDIRIGDSVIIRKAGMVIPEVVEVVKSKRLPSAVPFDFSKHVGDKCPACGGPIAKEAISVGGKKEVAWRCQNVAGCPAQKTRRVEFFAQRKSLDIESLGGVVAEKLIERSVIKEPLDLFELTTEILANLNLGSDEAPRMFGEKNASKVIKALERAKTLPLGRWLHALGIPNVGENIALQLARLHRDFRDLATSKLLRFIAEKKQDTLLLREELKSRLTQNPTLNAEAEKTRERIKSDITSLENELSSIETALKAEDVSDEPRKKLQKQQNSLRGKLKTRKKRILTAGLSEEIGPVVAKSLLDFFDSPRGQSTLERMDQLGIDPKGELGNLKSHGSTLLSGQNFVLTGTLTLMAREEAAQEIRNRGGNVTNAVSKNTTFLIVGENAGATKSDQAKSLGVKELNEKQFFAMIGIEKAPAEKQKELL